ncbi:hypothetical protein MCC93_00110 [Morococcus cerebrosus]|uniref:Uncharacterized protein n=1 Tax=Morococcus cerebrosus TaxID=1056807 RepID=A0A0C1EVN1_9NEIS|nr:hypothetical protein MCC93_00110 [Morococcus cerebrosus]
MQARRRNFASHQLPYFERMSNLNLQGRLKSRLLVGYGCLTI